MREYRYLHLDVFTSTPFEGNQLAVFPEPQGLTTDMMQTITREMNFSECTFIFSREDDRTDVRMRIFTPGSELPMAGHPTIGSTFALALEGTIERRREQFVFGLNAGPTPVSLDWNASGLAFAWMTQPIASFGSIVADRAAFTAAIGVQLSDLAGDLPIQVVSSAVPFTFVPLTSRAAVDAVAIDPRALARCHGGPGAGEIFVFTTEGGGEETVYSRMLAPAFGIAEDPATGIATGPLGCYLVRYRMVPAAAARSMVSLQGVKMKRPSRLHISIDTHDGEITRVRVGGQSVLVGRGEIDV
jgi:trans-2,3-dihydro-3-hydroxyanthranilate isomerase